jgi:hypothetical protein
MAKPYQWLAWIATVGLLTAATLAAFNIHPYYIWAFMVSNTLWIIVGVLWKEKTVIVMNAGLTAIYIAGIISEIV